MQQIIQNFLKFGASSLLESHNNRLLFWPEALLAQKTAKQAHSEWANLASSSRLLAR